MFVETVTGPMAEWQRWTRQLRMFEDPPLALAGSIAWTPDGDTVVNLNIWDSPEAVADFFEARVQPLIEIAGPPTNKPVRHGTPLAIYLRPAGPLPHQPRAR